MFSTVASTGMAAVNPAANLMGSSDMGGGSWSVTVAFLIRHVSGNELTQMSGMADSIRLHTVFSLLASASLIDDKIRVVNVSVDKSLDSVNLQVI